MKKALRKDFFMEIRKSYTRFLSILFIVALGVAFFSGIQAASPDMRYSGDAYFDEKKLMDLKVMGTLGMTEKDQKVIEGLSGVEQAELGYATDVVSGEGEEQRVLHLESLSDSFNLLTVDEGVMPRKKGECLLDNQLAEHYGYSVGDTISFWEEGDKMMTVKELKVTGIGSSAAYISFNRGNTTLGTGEVAGFAYVTGDSFESEVYTQIHIRAKGAGDHLAYTDAYDELIEKVETALGGLEAVQCKIRYDDVQQEGAEKLSDARRELSEGKKEAREKLADAEKELEDGENELADGKAEYKDGVKKLFDARRELSDGRVQLEDGKSQYQDGVKQLKEARRELDSRQRELDLGQVKAQSAAAQLADGQKQLDKKWQEAEKQQAWLKGKEKKVNGEIQKLEQLQEELTESRNKLNLDQRKKELEESQEVLTSDYQTLADAQEKLTSEKVLLEGNQILLLEQLEKTVNQKLEVEEAVTDLTVQKEELEGEIQGLKQQAEEGSITSEELEGALVPLQARLVDLEGQLSPLYEQQQQLLAAEAGFEESIQTVQVQLADVAKQQEDLDGEKTKLDKRQKEIDENRTEIKNTQKGLDATQKFIDVSWISVQEEQKKIEGFKKQLSLGRTQLDAAQTQLNEKNHQLSDSLQQLNDGQSQINSGWDQLNSKQGDIERAALDIRKNDQRLLDGEKEIEENEVRLADGKIELADGRKRLRDGKKEYEDAKKESDASIAKGERKISDARKDLNDLKEPEWIISTRNDLPEYSGYGDNAARIKNIGQVFPVLFFLVAALISLTTMTRMVEEQRTQIGTLKALGYGKGSIAAKYLLYALAATLGGCILGILVGEKLLPFIIIRAYRIMYTNMDALVIPYELKYAAAASGGALLCTMAATISACYKELLETPAGLMRPPAPKAGKRVFLERIPMIWKSLNFTWKATVRNLMRYKKRFLMTVFGIGGCMALLLVGYGLRDSIMDIARLQYNQIQTYDGIVILEEDTKEAKRQGLQNYLEKNFKLEGWASLYFRKMQGKNGKHIQDLYLYVPQNITGFEQFVTLRDRITQEEYTLDDSGLILSEKTAKLLDVKVGDTIRLGENGKRKRAVVVTRICENYMEHYAYMSPGLYREIFKKNPEFDNVLFKLAEEYKETPEAVGRDILKQPGTLSINYTKSIEAQVGDMLGALDDVIWVLIIAAGMLAFVVLYNLNNINITERKRELATIKVLGFYDMETSAYVFRENIILTLFGVLAGAFLGVLLHRFTIVTVEVDVCMFGRNINPVSFLYSALFTIGFSAFVNGMMHFKLKKIDMVESLKSVE